MLKPPLALKGAEAGAPLLRAHDVPEMLQTVRVWRGMRRRSGGRLAQYRAISRFEHGRAKRSSSGAFNRFKRVAVLTTIVNLHLLVCTKHESSLSIFGIHYFI